MRSKILEVIIATYVLVGIIQPVLGMLSFMWPRQLVITVVFAFTMICIVSWFIWLFYNKRNIKYKISSRYYNLIVVITYVSIMLIPIISIALWLTVPSTFYTKTIVWLCVSGCLWVILGKRVYEEVLFAYLLRPCGNETKGTE